MNGLWQFLTSSSAPWWASLLGVALGSVATYFITSASDKRKFERDDLRRFEDDIRALYVRLMSASRAFSSSEPLAWSTDEERRTVLASLESAYDQLVEAESELLIIADNAICDRARDLTSVASTIYQHVTKNGDSSWPPIWEPMGMACRRFVEQVRTSLRIREDQTEVLL